MSKCLVEVQSDKGTFWLQFNRDATHEEILEHLRSCDECREKVGMGSVQWRKWTP